MLTHLLVRYKSKLADCANPELLATLEMLGQSLNISPDCWLVKSKLDVSDATTLLSKVIGKNDNIMITNSLDYALKHQNQNHQQQ
ncbi:MAG: hypothetical protein GXP08_18255 [Gammaproteobacteria bacterium]|nr:hypothetical protein [Gammaproteobacteria bacterium]